MPTRPLIRSCLLLARLGCGLAVAQIGAGCSSAPKSGSAADGKAHAETLPLAGDFRVNRYTLDNGLRLLVVEDHSSPTFAYETWFHVGSRDEQVGRTGLAHLFEHMMFRGTKGHPDNEFDRLLEGAGVEGENAFTSRDYTAYVQELPKAQLELIAQLESDRMTNLAVDEKLFKTELEVVQNERRFRNENSPDGLMYQEIFGLAFARHPYHWPVVGYQADLERMRAQDAMDFYHAYYSPNHATIAVVGDVDPAQVLSVVQKYYGPLPAQPTPTHAIPAEPAQTKARRKDMRFNIQVQKLLLGYHVPAITSPDIPAIDVVQSVLTGGKSSRLHRALVETGVASSVDAYDLDDKDPSLFLISVSLQKGKAARQAEQIILREIRRLATEPVSADELTKARNRLAFGFYEGFDTNSEKARFLGQYETLTGDFRAGIEQFKRLETIQAADVQKAAAAYLRPENRSTIVGLQKGKK